MTATRGWRALWAAPAVAASGLVALLPSTLRPEPLGWVLGTALLAGTACAVVTRRPAVVGIAALAVALGVLVPLRVGVPPVRPALLALAATALVVVGVRVGRAGRTARALADLGTRRVAALVALAVALVLRALTALGPAPASGTLPLVGVQVGELTRYLAAVGAALAIAELAGPARRRTAVDRRFLLAVAGLLAGYLATLAVVGDLGPGALLVLGVAVAAVHARGLRLRSAVVALPVVAALVPLAAASSVLRTRLGEVVDPGAQLSAALTAAWSGGLVGPGPGHSPLVEGVPVIRSDYALAALLADLGALAVVPVLLGLLAAIAHLVRATAARPGPTATAAVALSAMLLAQGAWNALGTLGVLPLTGLDQPFFGVNGASLTTSALVLGLVLGVLERPAPLASPRGARPLTVAATAGVRAVAVLVAAAAVVVVLQPRAIGDAEQIRMPRGTVWTVDGRIVATDRDDGRSEPAGGRYADLGAAVRHRTHRGLEAVEAGTLTCGGRLGPLGAAASLLHPVCRTADVVTTVDSRTQTAVADALAGADADAVVLDAPTGAVRALFSTATRTPGDPSAARSRQGPPGSTMKLVTAAAALMAGVDFAAAPADAFRDGAGLSLANAGGAVCPATDPATALARSCNSVYGWAAARIGPAELDRVARTYFGAGGPVRLDGLDAPGLETGLGAARGRSGTSGGAATAAVARSGIGQESVRSSVLGVALATAAVADAGGPPTPWPHVVAARCTGGDTAVAGPGEGIGPPLPGRVGAVIRAGMRAAVTGGTARSLVVPAHRDVVAKTGTAQVRGGVDSWVTAITDGRYVVTLVVHHPAAPTTALDATSRILAGLPRSFDAPVCPSSPVTPQEDDR